MSGEERKPIVMNLGDDELTEVIVSDEAPPEDDIASEAGETVNGDDDEDDFDEEGEEVDAEEEAAVAVHDMSHFKFDGHTDSVYCVKIHPTIPGLVVTGGGDDKGFLWRYADGAGAGNSSGGSSSGDAAPMEEGAEEGVTVMASTGTRAGLVGSVPLTGHKDTVAVVDVNYDGRYVLTGAYDGQIQIWDVSPSAAAGALTPPVATLTCLLEGPEDVEWATWHNKGNAVLAGSRDGTMWMWLTTTAPPAVPGGPPGVGSGQCVQVFAGHDGGVAAGCFSTDGKTVCSGGEDGTVRLWAPKTGVCKHVFEGHFGHTGAVTCMTVSTVDPELLVTGAMDGVVRVFHMTGKRVLHTLIHSIPKEIKDEAAAAEAAAAGGSNNKKKSGGGGSKGRSGKSAGVGLEDYSDHEEEDDEDDEVMREEILEEVPSVECVALYCGPGSAGGGEFRFLASGGTDKTLKIWDLGTGQRRCICSHEDVVTSVRWHSSFPVVATSSVDCTLRLYDGRSGACVMRFTGHTNIITAFDMRPLVQAAQLPAAPACGAGAGSLPPAAPGSATTTTPDDNTDVIVSVSDDGTARAFHFNMARVLQQGTALGSSMA